MKKLAMAFVTILIVAGMATSALADPGWSNGHRHDNYGRQEWQHHQYYQQHYNQRDHHNNWEHHRQPVVVERVPVMPPRPVVHAYEPRGASFSMFLPGFSIQVR